MSCLSILAILCFLPGRPQDADATKEKNHRATRGGATCWFFWLSGKTVYANIIHYSLFIIRYSLSERSERFCFLSLEISPPYLHPVPAALPTACGVRARLPHSLSYAALPAACSLTFVAAASFV